LCRGLQLANSLLSKFNFDKAFARLLRLSGHCSIGTSPGRTRPPCFDKKFRRGKKKKEIRMKKLWVCLAIGIVALSTGTAHAAQSSQSTQSAQGDDCAAPPSLPPMSKPPVTYGYDIRPQALFDLEQMKQRFVCLAEAIPADKYNWRPEEGVRSIAEVYLHITSNNYMIPEPLGVAEVPAKYKAKDWEKSTTDKATIVAELRQSFDYAIAAITKVPSTEIATSLPKLGPEANKGDVEYLLVTHMHEHLGQSIGYARSVGVTPPWTAAAEAAAKKKTAEGKSAGQQPE
jgi:uncharacterized damage-inducible protein DinB